MKSRARSKGEHVISLEVERASGKAWNLALEEVLLPEIRSELYLQTLMTLVFWRPNRVCRILAVGDTRDFARSYSPLEVSSSVKWFLCRSRNAVVKAKKNVKDCKLCTTNGFHYFCTRETFELAIRAFAYLSFLLGEEVRQVTFEHSSHDKPPRSILSPSIQALGACHMQCPAVAAPCKS